MEWIDYYSDNLNVQSISVVESLQEKFSRYDSFLVQVSVYGDNREAFVFFFPMLAGMSLVYGAKLLWAAIFVEWSNLILKWLMRGDRPYWYVHETIMYTNATRPALRQFDNTCESGPGTPSGHLMLNVAVFYIFVRSFCTLFVWNNRVFSQTAQRNVAYFCYAMYCVWIMLVFVSRIYILAHFIHQCALGVVLGLLIGHWCWKSDTLCSLGSVRSILLPIFLFLSSLGIFLALIYFGHDPLWSVNKALQYCDYPGNVRTDAQPYYIMARFTGAALGLGLGMSSDVGLMSMAAPGKLLRSLLACKGGIFMGRLATVMLTGLSTDNLSKYLSLVMGVHAALPYTLVTTLPFILLKMIPMDEPTKKKN